MRPTHPFSTHWCERAIFTRGLTPHCVAAGSAKAQAEAAEAAATEEAAKQAEAARLAEEAKAAADAKAAKVLRPGSEP